MKDKSLLQQCFFISFEGNLVIVSQSQRGFRELEYSFSVFFYSFCYLGNSLVVIAVNFYQNAREFEMRKIIDGSAEG